MICVRVHFPDTSLSRRFDTLKAALDALLEVERDVKGSIIPKDGSIVITEEEEEAA